MTWGGLLLHGRWLIHVAGAGLQSRRVAQLERAEDRIKLVTADIAKDARAEIPPAPPTERQIRWMIRPGLGRPKP